MLPPIYKVLLNKLYIFTHTYIYILQQYIYGDKKMPFTPPKVHVIQITVDDTTYKKLNKKKGKRSWNQVLYEDVIKE